MSTKSMRLQDTVKGLLAITHIRYAGKLDFIVGRLTNEAGIDRIGVNEGSSTWRVLVKSNVFTANVEDFEAIGIRSFETFKDVLTVLTMIGYKPIEALNLCELSIDTRLTDVTKDVLNWISLYRLDDMIGIAKGITDLPWASSNVDVYTYVADKVPVWCVPANLKERPAPVVPAAPPKPAETEPLPPPPGTPASLDSVMNLQRQVNGLTNRVAVLEAQLKSVCEQVANLAINSTRADTELENKIKALSGRPAVLISGTPSLPPKMDSGADGGCGG